MSGSLIARVHRVQLRVGSAKAGC